MENFNKQSKVVAEITSKIGSLESEADQVINEYSFYSVGFSKNSVTMQGDYNSAIVRRLQKEYDTTSEISPSGFVIIHIKYVDTSIVVTLT